MPWQFRLSVRPSVTRVDQSKTVEARITQFSPYSSPIPLVYLQHTHDRGKQESGRLRCHMLARVYLALANGLSCLPLSVNISKTVPDTAKVTIND